VDGRGVRAVVFLSGCNLKCPFCHNPETLYRKGEETDVKTLGKKLLRYKDYLSGGVTLSGGEPFLQAEFCAELIEFLAKNGLKTAIETNGHIIAKRVISLAEYFIVDVKNQETDDLYPYTEFLKAVSDAGKTAELTCVIVKGVNDNTEKLKSFARLTEYPCVTDARLLPFSKMCEPKYEKLGMAFPYADKAEQTESEFFAAEKTLKSFTKNL
jgi:pyruvate formate lyase activating enzyme